MSRTLFASLMAALLVVGGVALYAILTPVQNSSEQGSVPIGGPFELTSEDGSRVSDADFKGRYMLLYFGYTYCPDVCPTGLATMMSAYDQLPDEVKSQVAPVFITVDPERDTQEIVAEYTELFHDDLLGLTGTVEEIEQTKTTFRVYAKKVDGDPENYLVDHATFTYLIGPDGMYTTHFNHGGDAEAMAAGIIEKTS